MAQSVEPPTSAQVTISRSMSSRPASGSGLMVRNLEPASDSVSPSLSDPSRSFSVSKINLKKIKKKKENEKNQRLGEKNHCKTLIYNKVLVSVTHRELPACRNSQRTLKTQQ